MLTFSTILLENHSSCNLDITFPNFSSGEQFTIVDPNNTLLRERTFTFFLESRKILTRWAQATKHQVGMPLMGEI